MKPSSAIITVIIINNHCNHSVIEWTVWKRNKQSHQHKRWMLCCRSTIVDNRCANWTARDEIFTSTPMQIHAERHNNQKFMIFDNRQVDSSILLLSFTLHAHIRKSIRCWCYCLRSWCSMLSQNIELSLFNVLRCYKYTSQPSVKGKQTLSFLSWCASVAECICICVYAWKCRVAASKFLGILSLFSLSTKLRWKLCMRQ